MATSLRITTRIETGLRNVWNKYIGQSAGSWDRQYQLGYANLMETPRERGRHCLLGGILVDRFSPKGEFSILDVGCGAAPLYRVLPKDKARYRGIDLSETAIARAKRDYSGAWGPRFQVTAEAFETFASEERFDAIVFNEMLYYVPLRSLQGVLQKARSLLLAEPTSLLLVSMSQNPKAGLVWPLLRALSQPVLKYRLTSDRGRLGWRIVGFQLDPQ